jgi:predicted anti-sigma-YlaC factor YlaD
MTCAELQTRLQAYASGTMSGEEEAAFEAHLSLCESCSTMVALAESAVPQTAALPKSIAPTQDLWPAIQSTIDSRRRIGRVALPRWALAAAAVLLMTVSSGVTVVLLQRSGGPSIQAPSRLIGFEAEYSAASEDLSAALWAARSRLAPETIATIERNLAVIDHALAEARAALAQDPGNPALEPLVVAAWRQKMDLLRRATVLSGDS